MQHDADVQLKYWRLWQNQNTAKQADRKLHWTGRHGGEWFTANFYRILTRDFVFEAVIYVYTGTLYDELSNQQRGTCIQSVHNSV